MAPPPVNIKSQLNAAIRKFKFDELESVVLPQFPETSWDEIRYKLIEDHKNFTTSNALKMIELVLNEKHISDTVLRNRLALLEVIEVSRHSKRKIWYGYELKKRSQNSITNMTIQEMRSCIVKNFNSLQMTMDIRLVAHGGITYAAIKEKQSSRRLLPVFMALFFDEGYFFCAKKNVTKDILHVITQTSGFTTCKKLALSGRDIMSLVKMLQLKNQGVSSNVGLCNSLQFTEAKAIVTSSGIDFRQNKQRKEHLEQCFGEEPPTIDVLVFDKKDCRWVDEEISKKLSDIKFNMQWEFKSHNVTNFLTQLAEKRVITNPLPKYITGFLNSGKNYLTCEASIDNKK